LGTPALWTKLIRSSPSTARAIPQRKHLIMGQAIGNLLPSAIGVALSPIPIIAVILMLGTPRAKSNGPAFALGWIVGLVVVSVIVLLVASGADKSDSGKSTTVDIVEIVIGALFLLMALGQWRKRPQPGVTPETPKWMAAIDQFTIGKSLGLGAILSGANPKNLALTLAAAASIAQAGLSAGGATVAIAVFVAIGSVTVAGPVLFDVFAAEKASGPLDAIKQFMSDHNAVIMMIIFLVLGAKLIGNGIAGLSS
jgi:threonine/homoserine/homoserine lactone efflux protein